MDDPEVQRKLLLMVLLFGGIFAYALFETAARAKPPSVREPKPSGLPSFTTGLAPHRVLRFIVQFAPPNGYSVAALDEEVQAIVLSSARSMSNPFGLFYSIYVTPTEQGSLLEVKAVDKLPSRRLFCHPNPQPMIASLQAALFAALPDTPRSVAPKASSRHQMTTQRGASPVEAGVDLPDGPWTCGKCLTDNRAGAATCEECGRPPYADV
ncbi:MAG TPA: Ran-binding zinc finger domain-containing protein [Armatimonadota bacterium]|jgi:hypothetical protein